MSDKYLTKFFFLGLAILVLTDLFSYLAINWLWLENLFYLVIIIGILALSIKDLRWGFYAVMAELMIGSQGHLFDLTLVNTTISLRQGLFAIVLVVWLFGLFFSAPSGPASGVNKNRDFFKSRFLPHYLLLFVFIILGAVGGLLNNSSSSWFYDFNGWLFFLITPVAFAVINNYQRIKEILIVFFSAMVFLSVKTLGLLLIFTYGWPQFTDAVYGWLRNSRLAEITFIAENLYRIFMQSQIYLLIGFLASLTLLFFYQQIKINKNILWLVVFLTSLSLLASLSRSYWVGGGGGLVFLFGYLLIKARIPVKAALEKIFSLAVVLVLALVFLQAITGNYVQAALGGRLGQAIRDPAGQSRLQQLRPVIEKISTQPLLGFGFGAEVGYFSSDPRILQDYPDGLYTTYAFEWGYLDIWLKMGLLGLLAYLALTVKIGLDGVQAGPLGIGLTAGLLAVTLTSIFSPYLNHPLGIGYLIIMSAIISVKQFDNGKS